MYVKPQFYCYKQVSEVSIWPFGAKFVQTFVLIYKHNSQLSVANARLQVLAIVSQIFVSRWHFALETNHKLRTVLYQYVLRI